MSRSRPEINIHPQTFPAADLKQKVYDVVVIGGGPGGMTTAAGTAEGGLSTLLVESELAGGECVYWACIPSKALLRSAESLESARAVTGARELLEQLSVKHCGHLRPVVDVKSTFARRDMFTGNWTDTGPIERIHGAGVDFAHGIGRLTGTKKVEIVDWHSGSKTEVTANRAVVIATGSAPIIPDIEGLAQSAYWTPREAVSANEVPEALVIIGGGAVGVEMATLYNQLGSRVTLLCHGVLPKFVPEAGRMVEESLVKAGVTVRSKVDVKLIVRKDRRVVISLSDGSTIEGTEVLVATGRQPRTTELGLSSVGLSVKNAWLDVDDSMCSTSVPGGWLWAVGDVNGRALLTHVAKYQAKVASHAIVAKAKGSYDNEVANNPWSKLVVKPKGLAIAQSIFSDPQVASSGITAKEATARGIKARTISAPMSGPGFSLHADGYTGYAQWVVDEANVLLGATFVGRDAIDLLQASTMAIVGRMTLEQIWHVTPPFPTMSEIYSNLSEAAERESTANHVEVKN